MFTPCAFPSNLSVTALDVGRMPGCWCQHSWTRWPRLSFILKKGGNSGRPSARTVNMTELSFLFWLKGMFPVKICTSWDCLVYLKDQEEENHFKSCHAECVDIAFLCKQSRRMAGGRGIFGWVHDLRSGPSTSPSGFYRCKLGRFDDKRQSVVANARALGCINQYVGLFKGYYRNWNNDFLRTYAT